MQKNRIKNGDNTIDFHEERGLTHLKVLKRKVEGFLKPKLECFESRSFPICTCLRHRNLL